LVALAYCLTAISEAAGDFLCPEIALGITLKLEPVGYPTGSFLFRLVGLACRRLR